MGALCFFTEAVDFLLEEGEEAGGVSAVHLGVVELE